MSRLLASVFIAASLGVAAAYPAVAQTTQPAPVSGQREASVIVSGEGQSALAPDMAVISLAVMREADTAAAAMTDNNAAMKQVLDALKSAGIEARDLQTSGLSITPVYRNTETPGAPPKPPEITGYQVTNQLTVKVRDLSKLGSLLDQAVKLGVNEGGNISFLNDKPEPAIAEARKKAVADAAAKAKTLAEAAGVSLGRIIEISENTVRPMPQTMYRASMMKEMSDAAVPVEGGENSYSVTVNITYAITQ